MPHEISAALDPQKCSAISQLVLDIQQRDDPRQNRKLIALLQDALIDKFRSFTLFGPDHRFRFLEQVLESFTQRHLGLVTDQTQRSLSYLYRFRPEEGESFTDYLFEKLEQMKNVYEPHATWLVSQIQAGREEEENKGRLVELLYPFISRTAYQAMNNRHYQIFDIEEAIAYQVERLLCHGREGWTGKNNQHYESWLYEFDPALGRDFCSYFSARLYAQFLTWCRRMDGVQMFRDEIRQDREALAGEPAATKIRTYYASVETSMDAGSADQEGRDYESTRSAIAAAQAAEEALQLQEEQRLEERMREKEAEATARLFLHFFDMVDGLDEDRPGVRSVTERGIVSYHLKFSTGIWNRLRTDGSPEDDRGYDGQAQNRPRSFRQLAMKLWDAPLLQVTAYQSGDYRRLFRQDHPYLSHLARRISHSGLEHAPYLEAESDIQNKAPGWAATIERRVRKDYQIMIVDRFKQIRREFYDEIQ